MLDILNLIISQEKAHGNVRMMGRASCGMERGRVAAEEIVFVIDF